MKLNTHVIVTDKDAAAGTEKMMAAGERWLRNALTLHELSSENADNVSLLTDPGSPSRLYLIPPQHAFLIWDDKTPKHIDHQWRKAQTKWSQKKSSLKCPRCILVPRDRHWLPSMLSLLFVCRRCCF